ncbi:MAG: hypothetical protein BWY70_02036 [Bacteroidetes bacterium ADurb.Bin408]|nr:MAG: hypothetical protein BWY70_02036 [Bacteroidetes bacterium ADurb.Bin408]
MYITMVAYKDFIGTLPIKQNFNPMFFSQFKNTVLGINAGRREWFLLEIQHAFKIVHHFLCRWCNGIIFYMKLFCNFFNVGALIFFETGENCRKCFVSIGNIAQLLLYKIQDGGTVYPATEACSNRHIASQSSLNRYR